MTVAQGHGDDLHVCAGEAFADEGHIVRDRAAQDVGVAVRAVAGYLRDDA